MPAAATFFLLQCGFEGDTLPHLDADCRAFCAASQLRLQRVAWAAGGSSVYVYACADATGRSAVEPSQLAADFAQRCAWARDVRASELELMLDVPGASQGEAAVFHYVVETDPEAGWMPEIARWYDNEHMPGLAAVPGCIRAMRFVNHGHGPLSLACYDLVREDTLGSPAWLAVRGTPWSDIARPHFTNTRRTMFRVPPSA